MSFWRKERMENGGDKKGSQTLIQTLYKKSDIRGIIKNLKNIFDHSGPSEKLSVSQYQFSFDLCNEKA